MSAAKKQKEKKPNIFVRFGRKIRDYFVPLGQAMAKGDVFTKLSFLISGFGYFFHHQEQTGFHRNNKYGKMPDDNAPTSNTVIVVQWLRGVFYLAIEALAVLALIFWGIPNFAKLSLTNLVPAGTLDNGRFEIDPATGEFIFEKGDSSFQILLFSLITILVLVAFVFIHISSIKGVYKSERDIAEGRPIRTAKQDLKALLDEHFYITVLSLPILGVILFTVVPTLMMILIAFTNYGASDGTGEIGMDNFTWVGTANFGNLFNIGKSASFAKVFGNQLLWTLIWAFFAAFTCFIGGLLLALLLNSKRTKFVKVWRTGFVLTIAVPQFVSLMLIRYFLADNGIVNNIITSIWHCDPLPFLTDPLWTKFTVIIVNCWVGFPYLMLMISGILLNIPADLYESARIDGAGKTRMFWSITMPYILQVCTPYLISSFVSNINNFNVIYLLTVDGYTHDSAYLEVAARESDLLITWLYNMIAGGAEKQYYMASVVGIMMFVISTAFTLITFGYTTRGNRERRLG